MSELVDLIVKKTGIPAATAQTIVKMVLDYLKKKLPASIAGQLDAVMANSDAIKTAENFIGGLGGGKKK